MRDIPVFSTENGVASLVLHEVSLRAEAYITLQDTREPDKLLKECVDFCKAVGAERIYAKGHVYLEKYPQYSAVWQMERQRAGLERPESELVPVLAETIEEWRSLYNDKMKNVSNAATITRRDAEQLLKIGCAYYVRRDGEVIGIGVAEGDTLRTVISLKAGCGYDVALSLCSVLDSEWIKLEVSSTNAPAVKLYKKMGFVKTKELYRWYMV